MNLHTQIFLTGLAVAIPVLLAWGKIRIWEWQKKQDDE